MKKKKSLVLLLILTLVLTMAVPVSAAIKISNRSITLVSGQKKTLKITGTKKKVKWTTSKKSVATVTQTGVVTAKKKGTATITAKVGSKKYTCKVTVKNKGIIYKDNNYSLQYITASKCHYSYTDFLKVEFWFKNNTSYKVSPAFAVALTAKQGTANCGFANIPLGTGNNVFTTVISPKTKAKVYYSIPINQNSDANYVTINLSPMYWSSSMGKEPTISFKIKISN